MNFSHHFARFGTISCLLAVGAFCLAAAPAQAGPALSPLATFDGTHGDYPQAAVIQGSDGNFYGTTFGGGSGQDGTIFKVTPAGTLTTLYTFMGSGDGSEPATPLVQGSDGNFYGTTQAGGASGDGTVFSITPTGTLTTLATFNTANGANPSGLIQGSDGNFYGTTEAGGSLGFGSIFKMTPAGTLTTIYNFTDGADGAKPYYAALVQGSDGNFYGTTSTGGSSAFGNGTVFKVTPAGVLTTLHTFNDTDGSDPRASLIRGKDGNFYGTTFAGGSSANGDGTVFKITPDGVLRTLANFGLTSTSGQDPEASLVQGSDGNVYGTTLYGGTMGNGIVFRVMPSGRLTTMHNFGGYPNDGAASLAGLIQGTDGNFYGTTEAGGPFDIGIVFKLALAPPPPAITSFSPTSGQAGTVVTITGTNFNDTTRVRFHNADATIDAVSTDGTQITATLPNTAATGTITVDTPGGGGTSTGIFTVIGPTLPLTITSISPTSGPVGTVVTITGTNFDAVTRVRFHNADAVGYTVNAAKTQITCTVPSGAGTGTITVNEPGVAVTSTQVFTVTP